MSYDEDEVEEKGFKLSDGDNDEPLELEDEVGSFKFEEAEDDPDDRYH